MQITGYLPEHSEHVCCTLAPLQPAAIRCMPYVTDVVCVLATTLSNP